MEGSVNLRKGVVSYVAELTDCHLPDEFALAEARTQTVDLSGSVLETLDATAADISGSLILDRCRAQAITSGLTRIGGHLSLSGAHLANPGKSVLTADRMTVDSDMFCDQGFRAEGEIRLLGAHISGQLRFDGAVLSNHGDSALDCDTMQADSLWLEGVTVTGTLGLVSAQVRVLHDDPSSWPGRMLLDGFTYDDLPAFRRSGSGS